MYIQLRPVVNTLIPYNIVVVKSNKLHEFVVKIARTVYLSLDSIAIILLYLIGTIMSCDATGVVWRK